MNLRIQEMQLAIHQTHDCEATRCVEIVDVAHGGDQATKVYVFEIEGHAVATRCFAWGIQKDERTLLIPAILQTDEVKNAQKAVSVYFARFIT
jgi:hypothetical protein